MQDTGVISGRAAPPEEMEVAFYMGDDLVTTNLDKQIQLALYGDELPTGEVPMDKKQNRQHKLHNY